MSNTLFSSFRDFIHNGKEPWKANFTDAKYKEQALAVTIPNYNTQPLYELTFPDPLTEKTTYYKKLIDQYAVQELNSFHNIVSESKDKARLYQVYFPLSRTLPGLMNDLHNTLETLDLTNPKFEPDTSGRINLTNEYDNSYILHYLKHELIRLYLEVIEHYPDYAKDAEMDVNKLYIKFYKHVQPPVPVITDATTLDIEKPIAEQKVKATDKALQVLKRDFRTEKDSILSYKVVIKDGSKFALFEEKLFQSGFIDSEYNAIESHGSKGKLAAIYHRIIEKGYFNERIFQPMKPIQPTDIRAFLDYRYNTNLSQQFRRYKQNEEKHKEYLDSQYWLDSLPTLR